MNARAIPHIHMTEGLQAAISAMKHHDLANPGDPKHVRERLLNAARTFEDPAFYLEGEGENAELEITLTVLRLATLYAEHLKAGNHPDKEHR